MRRLLSIALIAAAGTAAFVLSAARDDGGPLKEYEVELDNAFGLVTGGDLKIGGVNAGKITNFRLTKTEPYRTLVGVEVSEPGFDSLRADARCDVRQQSLIGEYFIDCDLGSAAKRLPDGGRVPVQRTSSAIPIDLINNVMRRPYRERFRLIISELGTGLAGRPEELNEVIRRAHPALRETSETIAILRRQNKIISNFFRDADTVSEAVEPYKEQVARWAREASDTSAIQASRSEELGRYWNRLPDFLAELEPTLAQLQRTANSQIPTLRRLQRAAPELERFLRAAVPFARNTRGSIRALGEASVAGSRAFRESRNEIDELRRLARFAPRLGKPLRQFLQAIDDRRRSSEADPAARRTAPPAPDKTAYRRGQGFTGMEALWNYIHYQTLAINPVDEVGHLLRIVLIQGHPCAPYMASPTDDQIKNCNSWLGPNQPGVTTGDPTAERRPPRTARESRGEPARRRGRSSASDQEAPPVRDPGDMSSPQAPVPPDVRRLLRRLGRPAPETVDDLRSSGAPVELLDYLLGP